MKFFTVDTGTAYSIVLSTELQQAAECLRPTTRAITFVAR